MANPIDAIKALWADKKKRPWLLGGAGVAAGAAVLTMRRPTDPDEEVAEETIAQEAAATTDPAYPAMDPSSYLPPVYGGSGLVGGYDPGMAETDLSGVFDEIDAQVAQLNDSWGAELAAEQAARKSQVARSKKRFDNQAKRIAAQRRRNKRQDRQIAKLKRRAKKGPQRKRKRKTIRKKKKAA